METPSTLVIFDLRDPEAWKQAGQARRAWGRGMTEIYEIDKDHVVIEFKAGGALEQSA